jgi:DNA invertase Pin-like site-specific DNA recombinase
MTKFVAYYRVSTQRQGRSGLGLEAQRAAVQGFDVIAEYTEVESGRKCDRAELRAALAHAKREGATLLIAKLDRLARNVHFLTGLLESDVPIVAADMREADRTFLQMAAVFAEWEARKISERTKAALAAAKARGAKLGCRCPEKGGIAAGAPRRALTVASYKQAEPLINNLAAAGMGIRAITRALNAASIPTARGGIWHPAAVSDAVKTLEIKLAA